MAGTKLGSGLLLHPTCAISVEGNIGAGKSTFLQFVAARYGSQVQLVPEPIQAWTDVEGSNLLELFYSDLNRWAYTFQMNAFYSRVKQVADLHRSDSDLARLVRPDPDDLPNSASPSDPDSSDIVRPVASSTNEPYDPDLGGRRRGSGSGSESEPSTWSTRSSSPSSSSPPSPPGGLTPTPTSTLVPPFRLHERCTFSDRYVFAENARRSNTLLPVEWALYADQFDFLHESFPPYISGFVYLRTTPEVAFVRMSLRNRPGESGHVPLEYLAQIHDRHEDWLNDSPATDMYALPLSPSSPELRRDVTLRGSDLELNLLTTSAHSGEDMHDVSSATAVVEERRQDSTSSPGAVRSGSESESDWKPEWEPYQRATWLRTARVAGGAQLPVLVLDGNLDYRTNDTLAEFYTYQIGQFVRFLGGS